MRPETIRRKQCVAVRTFVFSANEESLEGEASFPPQIKHHISLDTRNYKTDNQFLAVLGSRAAEKKTANCYKMLLRGAQG